MWGLVVPLEWDLGLEVDWRRDECFVSLYLYLQRNGGSEIGSSIKVIHDVSNQMSTTRLSELPQSLLRLDLPSTRVYWLSRRTTLF